MLLLIKHQSLRLKSNKPATIISILDNLQFSQRFFTLKPNRSDITFPKAIPRISLAIPVNFQRFKIFWFQDNLFNQTTINYNVVLVWSFFGWVKCFRWGSFSVGMVNVKGLSSVLDVGLALWDRGFCYCALA